MITILKGKEITVEWKVVSLDTKQPVDFEGVNAKVFLLAPDNIYTLPFDVVRDDFRGLRMTIPTGYISTGVYDLKVIWLKDALKDKPVYRNVSVKREVFALTDEASEVTYDGDTIKIATGVESCGRDGLSAYEIAVFRGFAKESSEKEWVESLDNVLASEASRVKAEEERVKAEDERVKGEDERVKGEDLRIRIFTNGEEDRRQSFEISQSNRDSEFQNFLDNKEQSYIAAENNRDSSYYSRELLRDGKFETEERARSTTFLSNEQERNKAEEDRKKAEEDRKSTFEENEANRQSTFQSNEDRREEKETLRGIEEGKRDNAETIRKENETKRVDAEILRQEAETVREATYKNKVDRDDNAPKLTAGFANNLVGRGEATPQEISFRPSGGDTSIEDGTARIERVNGSALVWNQLAFNNKDISFSKTITGYATVSNGNLQVKKVHAGHKYYILASVSYSSEFSVDRFYFAEAQGISVINNTPAIRTAKSTYNDTMTLRFYITNEEGSGNSVEGTASLLFVDLTQMFGEGNEPTTIEEFNARNPINIDEYAYNEGELISNNVEELKSVGFNALNIDGRVPYQGKDNLTKTSPRSLKDDEYWSGVSSNGYYFPNNTEVSNLSIIDGEVKGMTRTISYGLGFPVRVLEGRTYRYEKKSSDNAYVRVTFYSAEGVPIGGQDNLNLNILTPDGCVWMMVIFYSNTVNKPFSVSIPCLHLVHTGYRNGEYKPYKEFRRGIPIKDIKDKDGNQLFPNGLLSAGSVYDEITATKAIKRIGVVDLGTLTYTRNAANGYYYSDGFMQANYADSLNNIACSHYITKHWGGAGGFTLNYAGDRNTCVAIWKSDTTGLSRVNILDDSVADAAELMAMLKEKGVMLYYELAEPIEVDLPEPLNLVYEVSDFGTEEVISDVPTTPMKADIIYQFNAVDRIRDNSRHTAESVELLKAKADKNKQLKLSVLDNGNIVLSNDSGESKEFMPATPSGDPMHYAYENMLLGAEFNAADDFKIKQTPWASYVDSIEYKAKWDLDIVNASLVQPDSLIIGGVSYRYAKDTRKTAYGVTVDRYRVVKQDSTTGKWVWDDSVVLHCPRCWYKSGIGDLTNREMYNVWNESPKGSEYPSQYFGKWCNGRLAFARRSNFSVTTDGYALANNGKVEVSDIGLNVNKMDGYFYGAENLRYIWETIQVGYATVAISNAFAKCPSLTLILVGPLKVDVSFNNSPKINKKSILYIINNCSPTKAITITLHADAYARLADDADIITALETKNAALEGTGGSINLVSA